MDFRALLQNQWFQLCLLVAVLSGGTSIYNLAKPGSTPTPTPSPISGSTPVPSQVTRVPGPVATPTPSASVAAVGKLKPKTPGKWIVDASGAGDADSRTLVGVISNLADGDIVTVRPGDYFEAFVLTKNVRIVGPTGGNATVTLHAQGVNTVEVKAKNVGLENLRIEQDTPGDQKALRVVGGSRVELVNCQLRSKSTFCCTVTDNATLDARDCLFQNVSGGSGLQFEEDSRGVLTRCTFSQSRWGLAASHRSQVQATDCTFQNLGLPTGAGATLAAEGGQAQITAKQCRFTNNTTSILAAEGATLALYDCVLSNNGVTGEAGSTSAGVVCARSGSRVTLKGDIFENNKQGIIAQKGSTLVLERVQIRGCGLVTDNQSLIYVCNNIAASGQGCTVRIAGSSIADSVSHTIVVAGGAQLTMIETTISNSGGDALSVGSPDGAAKAVLTNIKVLGARSFGVLVSNGSECEAQGCQILGSANTGFGVVGEKTTARLVDSAASGGTRGGLGLWAHTGGALTATGCTIENNARGAQAGIDGGGAKRGTITLENCTVRGNEIWGVGACRDSLLTVRGGFLGNQRQNVYQERGGSVRLER